MKPSIEVYSYYEVDKSYSVIIHIKNFFSTNEKKILLQNLDSIDNWETGEAFGNPIRRIQKWHHIDDKNFGTHWKKNYPRWTAKPYNNWLLKLQNRMQIEINKILMEHNLYQKYQISQLNINSVLMNKYRDGSDGFKAHKDDEKIFGNNPTILSVTFGTTRKFIMKRSIYNKDNPSSTKINNDESDKHLSFDLESGDILLMAGSSQKYFSHEVPKDEQCVGSRYNLTFRNHCF